MRTEYQGTLRPRITHLGPAENDPEKHVVKVEWIEGDDVNRVVWTETAKVPNNQSFIPQIVGTGHFRPGPGILVDENNHRHFVLNAEGGLFGAGFAAKPEGVSP